MRRAGGAAGLIALAAWLTFRPTGGVGTDEVWLLQVVRRMAGGETLYRDIAFGVTPLAAYWVAALARVLGLELLVVRAATAVSLCLGTWWTWRLARQCGASRAGRALACLALLAYGIRAPGLTYQAHATVFSLGCLSAVLDWIDRRQRRYLVLAGVLAGLALASKQNAGIFALAALLATAGRAAAAVSLPAFAVTALVFLVPIAASGGGSKFLEYGFTAKGTYLEVAGVSYVELFRNISGAKSLYWAVRAVLPAVLAPSAWLWWRSGGKERERARAFALFTAAAVAVMFPRADEAHLVAAVPALVAAAIFAATRLSLPRVAAAATAAWLSVGAVYPVLRPLVAAAAGRYQAAGLPHLAGVWIPVEEGRELRQAAGELAGALSGRRDVFLAFRPASLYSVVLDLRNPTPFDFPLVTTLGRQGEDGLIELAKARTIPLVCIAADTPPLSASRFNRWVRENALLERKTSICALYRNSP